MNSYQKYYQDFFQPIVRFEILIYALMPIICAVFIPLVMLIRSFSAAGMGAAGGIIILFVFVLKLRQISVFVKVLLPIFSSYIFYPQILFVEKP